MILLLWALSNMTGVHIKSGNLYRDRHSQKKDNVYTQ
jgi:hypothetical protein